jgi:hypothetical protein
LSDKNRRPGISPGGFAVTYPEIEMLSRKLLSGVAVGVLSVALVPVSWARTHAHVPAKTTTPAKLVTQAPTKITKTSAKTAAKPAALSKKTLSAKKPTGSKLSTHRISSHRLASHHVTSHKVSHVTTHSKVHANTLASHKAGASKLSAKHPSSGRLVKKTPAKSTHLM